MAAAAAVQALSCCGCVAAYAEVGTGAVPQMLKPAMALPVYRQLCGVRLLRTPSG
jgi:hypothetical protein